MGDAVLILPPQPEEPLAPLKLGRFLVSVEMLDRWDNLEPIFQGVIVTRAECDYSRRVIEYTAFSESFAVVPDGAVIPEYTAYITRHESGAVDVKWKQVSQI